MPPFLKFYAVEYQNRPTNCAHLVVEAAVEAKDEAELRNTLVVRVTNLNAVIGWN